MKFRPCIDIHEGKVKQIVGSTLENSSKKLIENFVSNKDAAYFADMYKRDNLTGGHVIMLGPGNEEEALKALRAYKNGLQIGGGIDAENANKFLDAGASHVIVTSYIFKDGKINFENLDRLVSTIGKDRLVLDLGCREKDGIYFVVTDRWQKFTDFQINDSNLDRLASYCSEFLIHAADVEGKCQGIQKDLVAKLGSWISNSSISKPLTYAGGISSFDDLKTIHEFGKEKIDFTIGSALDIFGGNLPYKDVVKWRMR